MPNKYSKKTSFEETVISQTERVLLIDSISFLLLLIQNRKIEINGDVVFTKHVCGELTKLAIKLQYEEVTEREIH